MSVCRRIFATAHPSLIGAPVLPMDPAEQRILDELRRRRKTAQNESPRAHG